MQENIGGGMGAHTDPEAAPEAPKGPEKPEEATRQQEEAPAKEQLEGASRNPAENEEAIARKTRLIEETETKIEQVREGLGLPPPGEEAPSVRAEREALEKLRTEEKDRVSPEEKKRLIQEEKEKILQEWLDDLFGELESLGEDDLASLAISGETSGGGRLASRSMGELEPGVARSLVQAFKEGIRMLPELLSVLPDLLKEFDATLSQEAEERVEQRLEEEGKKAAGEEEQKPEETDEMPAEESPAVSSPEDALSVPEGDGEVTDIGGSGAAPKT